MKGKQSQADKLETYVVDKKGSLGLLAIGYEGLRKWREVRDAGKPKKKDHRKKKQ